MNELEKIKEKIIKKAKDDIQRFQDQGIEIKDYNYKEFLENMASGKCNICKKLLELI